MKYIDKFTGVNDRVLPNVSPEILAYKFAMPLVRSVWPNLIAKDIVSVQPMASSNNNIFYLDYNYGMREIQVVAIYNIK